MSDRFEAWRRAIEGGRIKVPDPQKILWEMRRIESYKLRDGATAEHAGRALRELSNALNGADPALVRLLEGLPRCDPDMAVVRVEGCPLAVRVPTTTRRRVRFGKYQGERRPLRELEVRVEYGDGRVGEYSADPSSEIVVKPGAEVEMIVDLTAEACRDAY